MRRHLVQLIATLLLALLVFAQDEQVRAQAGHKDVETPAVREGESQQVLAVDVPPETEADGECECAAGSTRRAVMT